MNDKNSKFNILNKTVLLVFVTTLMFCDTGRAQSHLGSKLTLRPSFEFHVSYQDNVFRNPLLSSSLTGKDIGDVVFSLQARLAIDYVIGENTFYNSKLNLKFGKYAERNVLDNQYPSALLGFKHKLNEKIYFGTRDEFRFFSRSSNSSFQFYRNSLLPRLEFSFTKNTTGEAVYQFRNLNLQKGFILGNVHSHQAGFSINHYFSTKKALSLLYKLRRHNGNIVGGRDITDLELSGSGIRHSVGIRWWQRISRRILFEMRYHYELDLPSSNSNFLGDLREISENEENERDRGDDPVIGDANEGDDENDDSDGPEERGDDDGEGGEDNFSGNFLEANIFEQGIDEDTVYDFDRHNLALISVLNLGRKRSITFFAIERFIQFDNEKNVDFFDVGRKDYFSYVSLSYNERLNNITTLRLRYNFENNDSNDSDENFQRNSLSLIIDFQF